MPLQNGTDTLLNGFTYFPDIYPANRYDYRVRAINNLCNLMQSGMYRWKMWVSPNFTVPGYGSTPFDTGMVANTIIHGLKAYNPGAGNCTIKISLPDGGYITHNDYIDPGFGALQPYTLFTTPLIVPSGHVNVEISNPNADPVSVQIYLICAEPIEVARGLIGKYCNTGIIHE